MADPIHVLDGYYLSITFLFSLTIQSLAFLISYTLQFDKITDFSGGSNFFIIALITLLFGQSFNARNWVVSLAVMLWAIRLAAFLLFRVLKRGKDDRFDEMRSNFWRFGAFWIFQLLWVWIVSLPVTVLNSPNLSSLGPIRAFGTASDIIGLICFIVGMAVETMADLQKYRWKAVRLRAQKQAQNQDREDLPVCRSGVWSWSRHPNYFGDMLLWWGVWLMAIGSTGNPLVSPRSRRLLHATVISPIFITILLLFLSGLPTAERPVQQSVFVKSYRSKLAKNPSNSEDITTEIERDGDDENWNRFKIYLDQTSILIPIPWRLYRKIPGKIRRSVLLDWGIYRFDEHGPDAQRLIEEIRAEEV